MSDRDNDKQQHEENWESKTAQTGEGALKTEERSLDIGESGQFAPGGRYNELNATKPRRIDLDEQTDSALKKDNG